MLSSSSQSSRASSRERSKGLVPSLDEIAQKLSLKDTPNDKQDGAQSANVTEVQRPLARLPTEVLAHRQNSMSVAGSTRTSPGAPLEDQTGDEVPTGIPSAVKQAVPRGYKNVPSLDEIVRRLENKTTTSTTSAQQPATQQLEEDADGSKSTAPVDSPEPSTASTDKASVSSPAEKPHPLEHKWTLFHDSKNTRASPEMSTGKAALPVTETQPPDTSVSADHAAFSAGLTPVGTFSTVEDFARYFKWLKPPSQLETSSNYYIFKYGIQPAWEDPANAKGGAWVTKIRSSRKDDLDKYWSWLVMGLIGEQIDSSEQICGGVVSVRSQILKLQVWTRSSEDVEAINRVGKKIVKVLELDKDDHVAFDFQPHHLGETSQNKFISITPSSKFDEDDRADHATSAKPSMIGGGSWRAPESGTRSAMGAFGRGGGAFGASLKPK